MKRNEYLAGHRKFIADLNEKKRKEKERKDSEKNEMMLRDTNVLVALKEMVD